MTFLWLALASIFGWFVSTLAGGGSSLILIPIISIFAGTLAIPLALTVSGLIGNTQRIVVYWKKINWEILKWDLPGGLIGGCLGAFVLTKMQLEWLSLLVAFFLIFSALSYFFKPKEKALTVKAWYFFPAGLVYAFLSAIIGSAGPLLAPFYINYGLAKEEFLATQALNRVFIHTTKLMAYAFFAALNPTYMGYGLLLGLAAFPGNWLGHLALEKISEKRFKQIVISFVFISGVLILWQQQQFVQF